MRSRRIRNFAPISLPPMRSAGTASALPPNSLKPAGSAPMIAIQVRTVYYGSPKHNALREATYFAGLRKAGMPEE